MKRIVHAVAAAAMLAMGSANALIVVESGLTNSPTNAQNIDPAFGFIPDQEIEINSSFDLGIPNATVFGFSGDGTFDYYSFSVGTGASPLQIGQTVFFDTDYAQIVGLDTQLTLFGTDGTTVLASNDNAPFDGPGDLVAMTTNSFLSYTFASAGLYYIRVSQADHHTLYGVPLSTRGATYRLNVSTVPLPAAAWLFGSGLLAFFALSRKRKRNKPLLMLGQA